MRDARAQHLKPQRRFRRQLACWVAALIGVGMPAERLCGQQPNDAAPGGVVAPQRLPPAEVDLDQLLDLADSAPEQLPSIGVRQASPRWIAGPETAFDPDTSAQSPANSTGGLLSQAPGVVVRSTSALNQDVRIRGYSGSQLVGVANGVNQGKTRLDIDSLFSQIDPSLIENVTVISGPYSVEYGPGFAFIDAQLIAPRRADQLTFSSLSTIGFNTNGQQLIWRETAGYADVRSGAIVSFGQRMGNDYRPGHNSNDFDVPASYHVQDIYAALSNDVTDLSRLDIEFLHQDLRDTELPGVAYDIQNQHADQINLRWALRDEDGGIERLQLQFWWNQAAFNSGAPSSSKQRTFWNRLILEPYPDTATLVGNGLADNWGARALTHWGDDDTWQVHTGIDWRRIRQSYVERDFQADGSLAQLGDIYGIPDSSADDFGVFVGGRLALTDRWRLGAGQRLDWVRYGMDSSDQVASSTQYSPNDEFYPGFDTSTRALSMTYLTTSFQLTESLALSSGVAYAMRPPNLTELYSDQPFAPLVRFGNSFALGDSALDPEQNLQFDVGFTSQNDRSKFGARAFHSTIHDYIGLAANNFATFPQNGVGPPGTLDRGRPYMLDPAIPNQDLSSDAASIGYNYRNINRVTLYGFDVWGEHTIRPWLELIGSMAYSRGVNHDPTWIDVYTGVVTSLGGSEGVPGIYPLSATVALRLVEPEDRRWTLEWQSRFVSRQDFLAYSLGEVGTPGFSVHNIHATYRWNDRLSLRTSLLNVFDLNYYEHNSLAIVDRSGNIGFVKNPGISWFVGADCRF